MCIKVVEDVYQTVPEDQRKDRDAIESALGEYCKRGKSKLNSKERKACYYMVDIKRKVSDPLARGLPASRVCKKLKKANQELCEMRFRALPPPPPPAARQHTARTPAFVLKPRGCPELTCAAPPSPLAVVSCCYSSRVHRAAVKVDKNTNYKKLRVKQLKAILRNRGVECTGCLEKSDYIRRVKETEHMDL